MTGFLLVLFWIVASLTVWFVVASLTAWLAGGAIRLADRMEPRPVDADRFEDWAA